MESRQGVPEHLAEHCSQKEFPVSLVSVGTEFLRLCASYCAKLRGPNPYTLKSPIHAGLFNVQTFFAGAAGGCGPLDFIS